MRRPRAVLPQRPHCHAGSAGSQQGAAVLANGCKGATEQVAHQAASGGLEGRPEEQVVQAQGGEGRLWAGIAQAQLKSASPLPSSALLQGLAACPHSCHQGIHASQGPLLPPPLHGAMQHSWQGGADGGAEGCEPVGQG